MFKIVLFLIVINVSFFSTVSKSKTVLEIISETPSLQNFEIHLKKTGLDEVLGKKLPWNWTIFAPSNKAFENASSLVKQEILEDEFRTTMQLTGLHNFSECDGSFVEPAEPVVSPHQISPYTHIDLPELEYVR